MGDHVTVWVWWKMLTNHFCLLVFFSTGYKYVPGASKIEKTMKKRGYDQSTFVENYKYLINRPVDNHPLRYSFAKPSNLPNPHLPTQFSGPRMRFNYGYRPKLDKTSGYCPRPSYPKTAPGIGPTPGHTHTCTCTHDRKPGSSQDEASVERPMFYTMSGDDNGELSKMYLSSNASFCCIS